MHSDLTYDASHAHIRGRGDRPKNDFFFACHQEAYSALRTISISPNCVGEFSTDTG